MSLISYVCGGRGIYVGMPSLRDIGAESIEALTIPTRVQVLQQYYLFSYLVHKSCEKKVENHAGEKGKTRTLLKDSNSNKKYKYTDQNNFLKSVTPDQIETDRKGTGTKKSYVCG